MEGVDFLRTDNIYRVHASNSRYCIHCQRSVGVYALRNIIHRYLQKSNNMMPPSVGQYTNLQLQNIVREKCIAVIRKLGEEIMLDRNCLHSFPEINTVFLSLFLMSHLFGVEIHAIKFLHFMFLMHG